MTAAVDLDYDCLFTTKAAPVIRWAGVRYNSLGEFAAAVGEETHGLWSQPVFLDPAARDYSLPTNSVLIDKAMVIPGINDDYPGAAPDLGALESGMQATRIVVATNGVAIDWHVGAFGHYQLQSTPDLSPPAWNAVGEPVQAERTRLQLTDPSPAGAQRFYRLQHVAP